MSRSLLSSQAWYPSIYLSTCSSQGKSSLSDLQCCNPAARSQLAPWPPGGGGGVGFRPLALEQLVLLSPHLLLSTAGQEGPRDRNVRWVPNILRGLRERGVCVVFSFLSFFHSFWATTRNLECGYSSCSYAILLFVFSSFPFTASPKQ